MCRCLNLSVPLPGGLWGNTLYQGIDAEWPDTICVAGTTCTKMSSDHYQCRV
jgi:hypothetical protein